MKKGRYRNIGRTPIHEGFGSLMGGLYRYTTANESKDIILTPCIRERFRLGQTTFRHDCWWEQVILKE